MFLRKLPIPLFEQVSYTMTVQMLAAIPLMRHRTERIIPIVRPHSAKVTTRGGGDRDVLLVANRCVNRARFFTRRPVSLSR